MKGDGSLRKTSVLIVDGEDFRTLKVVRSLFFTGRYTISVVADSRRDRLHLSRCCKVFTLGSTGSDDQARISKIQEVAKTRRTDLFFPVGEAGSEFLSRHRRLLSAIARIPPLPSNETLATVRDKWQLHLFCGQHAIHSPASVRLTDLSPTQVLFPPMRPPFLIKPRIGAGGYGIRLIDSREAYETFLMTETGKAGDDTYMAQAFIEGKEIDLSALCQEGRIVAYTIQEPVDRAQDDFAYGKIIRFVHHEGVFATAERLLGKLRWNGVAHIDFICQNAGPIHVLDFNPRFWGTLHGSALAGVNFAHLLSQAALGRRLSNAGYQPIVYSEQLGSGAMLPLLLLNRGVGGLKLRNTAYLTLLRDPLPELPRLKRGFVNYRNALFNRLFRKA